MSAVPSQPLQQFYYWGFSGAPIQVHLSLEVVGAIRKQILGSENALGLATASGLLIGNKSTPGITRILGFEPLPSLDAASVDAASSSAAGQVVGFYRTTPTGSIAMPEDERALAASSFSDPSCVFLLIEIGKSNIGDARFCFWGEAGLFDWPLMLFPFDAEQLAILEWRRRSSVRASAPESRVGPTQVTPTQVTAPAEERMDAAPEVGPGTLSSLAEVPMDPPPEPSPESAALIRRESTQLELWTKWRQGGGWRWLALAALVTVAVLAGASLYFRRGTTPPAAAPAEADRAAVKTPLGLTVEKRGISLVISWDGKAPIISQANFGMLLIRGADVTRDIPLSADELRAGNVVYTAVADQVRFQLNVVAGDQVARESLIFVQGQATDNRASLTGLTSPPNFTSPPAQQRPPNLTGAPAPTSSPAPTRPSISTNQPISTSSQRSNSIAEETASPAANSPAPPPVLRQFKPVEKPASSAAPVAHIDEPPTASGAVPVPGRTPALLNSSPVSLPPAVAPATPAATPVPPAESLLAAQASPPVPTSKTAPNLPTLLKGQVWVATIVDVKVSVDASGNVTKAEAAAKPGLHPLLRDAAVSAARRWKFQPAQFNGHAVPAEIVVQFQFAASR